MIRSTIRSAFYKKVTQYLQERMVSFELFPWPFEVIWILKDQSTVWFAVVGQSLYNLAYVALNLPNLHHPILLCSLKCCLLSLQDSSGMDDKDKLRSHTNQPRWLQDKGTSRSFNRQLRSWIQDTEDKFEKLKVSIFPCIGFYLAHCMATGYFE